MTQLNSKSIKTILQEALAKDGDFLKEMVRMLLPEIREEERDAQVGVLSHQRDDTKRKANRNGYKPRRYKQGTVLCFIIDINLANKLFDLLIKRVNKI